MGGVLLTPSTNICTATLVGCRTVLTAAHCLFPTHNLGQTYPCSTPTAQWPANSACDQTRGVLKKTRVWLVLNCADLTKCDLSAAGGNVYVSVGALQIHPRYDTWADTPDLGLFRIAKWPGVVPSSLTSTVPTAGLDITLVGFGRAQVGQPHSTKRIATNVIDEVTATHAGIPHGTGSRGSGCYGDSGGPSFAAIGGREQQIGVFSWMRWIYPNGVKQCGRSYHARLDLAWIRQAAGGDVRIDGAQLACSTLATDAGLADSGPAPVDSGTESDSDNAPGGIDATGSVSPAIDLGPSESTPSGNSTGNQLIGSCAVVGHTTHPPLVPLMLFCGWLVSRLRRR